MSGSLDRGAGQDSLVPAGVGGRSAQRWHRAPTVLLDLGPLRFVDATGLFAMVRAHKRSVRTGGRFVILRCPGHVRRLLANTGLDRFLELESDSGRSAR